MASRKNDSKGKPQNHSNARNKGLSKDGLKNLQEMFGAMGISNNFINQVAQAHNYDVPKTANYLVAYADRMSKIKSQQTNTANTKQNPKNIGKSSSISKQNPKNLKQTSNSSASAPIVNKPKHKKNVRKNSSSSASLSTINKPKQNSKKGLDLVYGPGPFLLPPASCQPMKSFSGMFTPGQSVKFTDRVSTGAIKKVPLKSAGELEFERVVNNINTGIKVVVLLRGLPGSGKSYLARLIFDKTVKFCHETKPEYHIFSTDTYFEWLGGRQGYKFDPTRLSEAHEWNRQRFSEALKRGISPVIVDNTNTMAWEMHPYVTEGMKYGYAIEVLEPFTPWAFKNNELSRRNIHDVPLAKITSMNERYEHAQLTGARLIGLFGLQYIDNNKPPQMRQFPKTEEDSISESESSSNVDSSAEEDDDTSESLLIKYRYLCNIFPKLKIHHLNEIIQNGSLDPLWDFLNSLNLQYENDDIKCLLDVESDQLETKQSNENTSEIKHRYTREQLLNILPSDIRMRLQRILDGIKEQRKHRKRTESNTTETSSKNDEEDNVEENDSELIDWTSEWNIDENIPKSDEDESKSTAFSLLDLDDQFINNLPVIDIPKISDSDKNKLVEIEDSDNTSDKPFSLPTFKNFINFLTPKPIIFSQQSSVTTLEELLQSPIVIDASTMTNMNTFTIANGVIKLNDENCFILETHSRDISEGCPNVTTEKPPPKILKLDKSSMTHEDNFLEETPSQDDVNKNLIELVAMFPKIRKNFIRDIYDKCHGNFYWAIELLLDTPVDEDIKIEESSSEDEEIEESSPETEEEKCSVVEQDKITFSNKKINPDDVIRVKKQVEEQFVINDSHYSEHCLKIRRFRHGELPQSSADDAVNKQRSTSETSVNESDEETDSNETEDSMEDDECLEMTLGFDFVNRLDSIFGKENPNYPEGLQPVIQVPKSIAQQLHLLWLESYYQQVCAHEERWEQMLKEDEEFARKLQEQETEMSASGSQPQVPSIQEILNMEIDLEIARRGTQTNESYEDLASRLTRQKLYEMFSGIPKETVNDILDNFNNKYDDTVNYLIGVMGDSISNELNNKGIGSMFNEENLSNQEKQLIEQAKLASLQSTESEHRPMIVVRETATTSSRQQSPQSQQTNKFGDAEYYREIGQQELRLRNECLEKARNMYLRGLTSAALYYSELAQVHKNKYEQANQSAAIYFVNSHSQAHNNNNTLLDLHYLYVSEALQVLDLFIDNHISQLQNANKKCITLNLITGRGARSAGGRARVKPAVLRRLKQRHLRYHFINPGLLRFKLCHYDVMTNSLK